MTAPPQTRADLLRLGLTRGRLAGPHWRAPHRDRWVPADTDPQDVRQRLVEVASLLPTGAVLGGWAAAFLLGARDLDGRHQPERLPVPVVLGPSGRIRPRAGIEVRRSRLDPGDVQSCAGLPVTGPSRTAFDLARGGGVRDGVVAVDAMLRAGVVTLTHLRAYVAGHPGWRGRPTALAVLELADPGTRSSPETRFRLVWMLDAGLARPLVNRPVRGPTGRLLGIPDLIDVAAGLVGEYDGADHRSLDQHTADNVREERLEQAGLTVVRATALDLADDLGRLAARLRSGHARGLSRDRSRDRWSAD